MYLFHDKKMQLYVIFVILVLRCRNQTSRQKISTLSHAKFVARPVAGICRSRHFTFGQKLVLQDDFICTRPNFFVLNTNSECVDLCRFLVLRQKNLPSTTYIVVVLLLRSSRVLHFVSEQTMCLHEPIYVS